MISFAYAFDGARSIEHINFPLFSMAWAPPWSARARDNSIENL
jgi:hypothetical protein